MIEMATMSHEISEEDLKLLKEQVKQLLNVEGRLCPPCLVSDIKADFEIEDSVLLAAIEKIMEKIVKDGEARFVKNSSDPRPYEHPHQSVYQSVQHF